MTLESRELTQAEVEKFHKWLDSDQFEMMVKIAESKAFESEVNAANALIQGTEPANNTAQYEAAQCRIARGFAAFLRQCRSTKKFSIHKAVPSLTPHPTK